MSAPIVVDSSVAIKWFVVEPHADKARTVLDQFRLGALAFLAPDLLYAEFGNILWKKQQFQGLQAADARTILDAFQQLAFVLTSSAVLLKDAYELATRYDRSIYDSLYVALSVREQCQFVTADERLANSRSSTVSNVVWLGNWP